MGRTDTYTRWPLCQLNVSEEIGVGTRLGCRFNRLLMVRTNLDAERTGGVTFRTPPDKTEITLVVVIQPENKDESNIGLVSKMINLTNAIISLTTAIIVMAVSGGL